MVNEISETFLNKKRFTKMIEQVVIDKQLSYIDAIVHLCEEQGIDIEDSRKYISPPIQEKIKIEAIRLNYLEGESYSTFE